MLTDSNSPQIALSTLQRWRGLAETQEVLLHLQALGQTAQTMALASPDRFRVTVNRQEHLPDGTVIEQMRNQFIGNSKGLFHLRRLLDDRETELAAIIKEQSNQAQ